MYGYYKIYFDAINSGNEKLGIPKYNGGLFSKDEILDSLIIEDSFLDMEAQKLSNYDFASEISVREPLKIPFKAPNFYFFWFLKNLSPILTELY